jgi:hypothetical protein
LNIYISVLELFEHVYIQKVPTRILNVLIKNLNLRSTDISICLNALQNNVFVPFQAVGIVNWIMKFDETEQCVKAVMLLFILGRQPF